MPLHPRLAARSRVPAPSSITTVSFNHAVWTALDRRACRAPVVALVVPVALVALVVAQVALIAPVARVALD
jgi:hypothetical protein